MIRFQVPRVLTPGQSGQVATEYTYLVLGIALALAIVSYGIGGDVLAQLGDVFVEKLMILTTILKLPI